MTRTITGLLWLVLLPLSAPAQAPAQGWAYKLFLKDGQPQLTHDFGMVPRGATLTHSFEITNIWAVPLQITELRTSCGCVTATTATPTLQPRQSGTIDVTMDGRRFNGAKTVTIHVTVANPNPNQPFRSSTTLTVSATNRADVVFNPGAVDFGVLPRGSTPTRTIDVEYAGSFPWRLLGVAGNDAPVEVGTQELYRKPGGVGYRLTVKLKADAPAGVHRWTLMLQTNDGNNPTVPLAVLATVQAQLAAAPSSVFFGKVKPGTEVNKNVLLRGTQPFTVTQVLGEGDGVSVKMLSNPAPVQIVTIRYAPTTPGAMKKTLEFKTSLAGGESSTTVAIEGECEP